VWSTEGLCNAGDKDGSGIISTIKDNDKDKNKNKDTNQKKAAAKTSPESDDDDDDDNDDNGDDSVSSSDDAFMSGEIPSVSVNSVDNISSLLVVEDAPVVMSNSNKKTEKEDSPKKSNAASTSTSAPAPAPAPAVYYFVLFHIIFPHMNHAESKQANMSWPVVLINQNRSRMLHRASTFCCL
jgi:hypothetical protein